MRIPIALALPLAAGCVAEPHGLDPLARKAPTPTRYGVVEVPASLGGTNSRPNSIDELGAIAGFSNLPDNQTRHAALWRAGALTDLGTLGGPNSNVAWPGQSPDGTLIAGIAENADDQPLGEDWSCSAFFPSVTHKICRGVAWHDGAVTAMPTLGGDNSFATGANDRGQVTGWAETTLHDPSCNAPQVLQFLAVVWEPRSGALRPLSPMTGESTSAATAINRRGQVVGISGECDVAVGRFSAAHAVLWEPDGRVVDLGNLGGVSWHTAMAINEHGDVVGFSNPPGDDDGSFFPHAFLWTRELGIVDLGLLPGDDFSEALAINEDRDVVGLSCGAAGCRAVLWRGGGEPIDLTTLADPGFPDVLTGAAAIDDAGTITGRARVTATGATVPYVATPVD